MMSFVPALLAALVGAAPAGDPTDECRADMAATTFVPNARFKVVVTRFFGGDPPSEALGRSLGYNLRDAIGSYWVGLANRRRGAVRDAGLSAEDLQARYVACRVTDHTQARALGAALGADMVLWGQAGAPAGSDDAAAAAVRELSRALAGVHASGSHVIHCVSGNTVVNNGGKVDIACVRVDTRTDISFTTNLTAMWSDSLQTPRAGRGTLPTAASVMDATFPRLATRNPLALFHVVLAMAASRLQRHGAAVELFRRAGEMHGFLDDPDVLRLTGASYVLAGRAREGLSALEAAVDLCAPDDPACRATALHNVGWAHHRLGDNVAASAYYERSLALKQRHGGALASAGVSLLGLGVVHAEFGEYAPALRYFEGALAIFEREGDVKHQAEARHGIGEIHAHLGDKPLALAFYDEALELARDELAVASIKNSRASVLLDLGDRQRAAAGFRECLHAFELADELAGQAAALTSIAAVHAADGEYEEALETLRDALLRAKRAHDPVVEADVLTSIGAAHLGLGRPKRARGPLERALRLRRTTRDADGKAVTLSNLGNVYLQTGDPRKALVYFQSAAASARDTRHRADILVNAATGHRAIGDLRAAVVELEQALSLFRASHALDRAADTLVEIADTRVALGELDAAVTRYEEAAALYLDRGDPASAGAALNRLAVALAGRRRDQEAHACLERALVHARAADDLAGESRILGNLAALSERLAGAM